MQKFINNWSSRLTQTLSPSDTVIHIDIESANRLAVDFQQGDYYLLTLDKGGNIEIVKSTLILGQQLIVERGQEGTNSHNWDFGDLIEMRVTAYTLYNFRLDIDTVLTAEGKVLVSSTGNLLMR